MPEPEDAPQLPPTGDQPEQEPGQPGVAETAEELGATALEQVPGSEHDDTQESSEGLVSHSVEAGSKFLSERKANVTAELELFLESGKGMKAVHMVDRLIHGAILTGPIISLLEHSGIDLSPAGLGKDAAAVAFGYILANLSPFGRPGTVKKNQTELNERWEDRQAGNPPQPPIELKGFSPADFER